MRILIRIGVLHDIFTGCGGSSTSLVAGVENVRGILDTGSEIDASTAALIAVRVVVSSRRRPSLTRDRLSCQSGSGWLGGVRPSPVRGFELMLVVVLWGGLV